MRDDHWIQFPREVVIGPGVITQIPKIFGKLGLKGETIIVCGRKTRKIAAEKVSELLDEIDCPTQIVTVEKADVEEVRRVEEQITRGTIALVGVGGGKSIDVAKVAAHRRGIGLVSVPTSASHDGIGSPRASISGIEQGPVSISTSSPLAIVADTTIIAKAPKKLLSSGFADVIANFTAVLDWKLAYRLKNERYSEYASVLSSMTAERMCNHAPLIGRVDHEKSCREVVKALISSGVAMSIAGSSRPASGSEHKFSHALDIISSKPALHGEQCGVGTIMMMYLHGGDWKMIRNALKLAGAPVTAEELGIPDTTILEALIKAHTIRPERYTILGDKGLTPEAAEKVATVTGVIPG